jgi:hypothetical protein
MLAGRGAACSANSVRRDELGSDRKKGGESTWLKAGARKAEALGDK